MYMQVMIATLTLNQGKRKSFEVLGVYSTPEQLEKGVTKALDRLKGKYPDLKSADLLTDYPKDSYAVLKGKGKVLAIINVELRNLEI